MIASHTRLLAAIVATVAFLSARPLAAQETAIPKPADVKSIAIHPAKVSLTGSDDSAQIIVTATLNDGRLQDLTHDVQYVVADGKTAEIGRAHV